MQALQRLVCAAFLRALFGHALARARAWPARFRQSELLGTDRLVDEQRLVQHEHRIRGQV
jgi:hypothetical protein